MLVRGGQRCRPSCQSIDYLLCPSCQSIDYLLCPLSVSRSLTRTSLATVKVRAVGELPQNCANAQKQHGSNGGVHAILLAVRSDIQGSCTFIDGD